jgi:hypothetical protein
MDALLIISKSFDFAIEETSVYDIGGWVESEVKYLRVDGDDWHSSEAVQRLSWYGASNLRAIVPLPPSFKRMSSD